MKLKIKRYGTVETEDGAKISMATIPYKNIEFNTLNPNVMDEKMNDALEANIKKTKYLEFAVVHYNKKDQTLSCIDGEHRLKVLHDKQGIKFPVVTLVEGGISDIQVYSGAYTFNRIRGQVSPEKLGFMLQHGVSEWGEKKLLKQFSMQKYQLDEYLLAIQSSKEYEEEEAEEAINQKTKEIERIADHIRDKHTQSELKSTEMEHMEQMLMINMNAEKFNYVNRILKSIDSNLAQAIYIVCKKYEKSGHEIK